MMLKSSINLYSHINMHYFNGILGFQDLYNRGEKLLHSSLNKLGSLLAAAQGLDPVWAQVLTDPFLRRLLLR